MEPIFGVNTDCCLQRCSDYWSPQPHPPSSPRWFWKLPENLTNSRWGFSSSPWRQIYRSTWIFQHGGTSHTQPVTHFHTLSPIRRMPGEKLLSVVRVFFIFHPLHSGNLLKKNRHFRVARNSLLFVSQVRHIWKQQIAKLCHCWGKCSNSVL